MPFYGGIWSNAEEICQDIFNFFFNSKTPLVPNMLKSLFFWKMIEPTGLLLISCDKQTNKLEYLFFYW